MTRRAWKTLGRDLLVLLTVCVLAGIVGCASTGYMNHALLNSSAPQMLAAREGARVHAEPPPEELWVIARPEAEQGTDPRLPRFERFDRDGATEPGADDVLPGTPGTGALVAARDDGQGFVPLPLKHTDVKASIAGYIATTEVTQQYHNPFDGKIEAVYVFPLPASAAVNEFLMTIGERRIRGIIREREEAERIYADARSQGYVASLLTQERPNVFTQKVANIEPGKAIDIHIRYFHTLSYTDGWYEYVFPMVVGPRFNPPGHTDGIGAVGRGAHGASGQSTEMQYLSPSERSGHDIALSLRIDAGVAIEELRSVNHRVDVDRAEPTIASVALAADDSIPNKDFVLRYKVAGDVVKSGLMVQRDEKTGGGYFALMLYPPETLRDLPRKPLEMVFTLDVSGSMSGQPIEQSRRAIRYALTHMNPQDTFQVIRFFDSAEQLAPHPLPATPENVRLGMQYIEQMKAGGGTMMIEGIRQSLQTTSEDPERLRFVAFLTDGYIGNEAEILRAVHEMRGRTRIFSFGVGSSTNRYLLDHMARIGAGAAAYLSLNDDADEVMAAYFERISHPALTDIAIDFGGLEVDVVYPRRLPDLFVGRPVIVTGRFRGDLDETVVRVTGRVGGETSAFDLPVHLSDDAAQHAGIATVWARAKIADLGDQALWDREADLPGQIRQTALEHGLMSPYTAFVAVDSSTRTAGEFGTTVAVPVPVPEGVRYETTVTE